MILLLTDSGCEDACAREVSGKKLGPNVVAVDGSLEDAAALAYHCKTARRVLMEITPPVTDLASLNDVDTSLFPEGCTFKVEGEILACTPEKIEEHAMLTQELIEEVATWLDAKIERDVSLDDPDVVVFASRVLGKTYIGVDVSGKLAKREWRIMLSRRSLKSTIAASAVAYSGVTPKEKILDPFGDDGTLAIEAALLLSKTSAHKFKKTWPFEKLGASVPRDTSQEIKQIEVFSANHREMKSVRTNGKLASVEKFLHSTKVSLDWINAKLPENAVDHVLTHAPQSGKALSEKHALKLNDEMFSQATSVLKPDGLVTCVAGKPEELVPVAEKRGFTVKKEHKVLMGKMPLSIITFAR